MTEEKKNQKESAPPHPSGDDGSEVGMSSSRYPIKSYQGILTIAKREFVSNLKSVRMLVLMALFVLAVLGGSYGISGFSTSTQSLPDVEVLAWAIIEDYDATGSYNDMVVLITDGEGNPRANVQVEYITEQDGAVDVLFVGSTNQSGVVVINDVFSLLKTADNSLRVTLGGKIYKNVQTSYSYEFAPKPAYVMAVSLDLDDDNIMDDAIILVADGSGLPVEQANVTVSSSSYNYSESTDYKGLVMIYNLKAGKSGFGVVEPKDYDVTATYLGTTSQNIFYIAMDDDSVSSIFELSGPNEIIYLIAALFIIMLGPIIAISLSFDSITKEKLQRSLDFLLCRPTGRRSIIVGKFLGTLIAIILPVTAINIAAVGLISSITNESPDGALVAGFVVYTILFIATYILLQQIFSTLAKTTGTAILSGIAIWLIFNLFWSLISFAVGAALGYQFGSDDWIRLNNQMGLFNPGGAYQLALGLLLPASEGAGSTIMGVESWMPPAAILIWLVLLFFLATEIFVRKADS